ncbi:uncharacterized protein N7496_007626 [Penicillium cataractarum]|uniref:Uncharacterized protein n=1 Tax=Penicillium cataractarum TaxID=2100454 RepID=A0A9W9S5V6_9EURO|nr:uncharacterized protein N7496_007626 [Penicillium cataractarum]KAJ5371534.1 hypothetical protein N7496_007626 [Penicillium cataractarum]
MVLLFTTDLLCLATETNIMLKDPECAVDILAVFYSLSFALNPNFSKVFPPHAEILEYSNSIAERFDVNRYIVTNTEWEGAY